MVMVYLAADYSASIVLVDLTFSPLSLTAMVWLASRIHPLISRGYFLIKLIACHIEGFNRIDIRYVVSNDKIAH